jgi:hypothetical protein
MACGAPEPMHPYSDTMESLEMFNIPYVGYLYKDTFYISII